MPASNLRIGIVGAGGNTRARHIPGFRAIPGVEIAGVVNRTPESTAKAAAEFGIPKTYPDWQSLVNDPAIDAVCIGTWPNLHCEVTCAALNQGKHVLTEARMARNAAEARKMLAASQAHPKLVAQIVPSPFGLVQGNYIQKLVDEGYLGDLREVVVIGADDSFMDFSQYLHWRQDADISGFNVLTLGILHETVSRWIPATKRVFSQSKIFEPTRPSPTDQSQLAVTVPDSVQVLTQIEGGACGMYHFSGSILFGPGKQIHLYGRRGTIKLLVQPQEMLLCGRVGQPELRQIDIPPELRGGWRVEAEFVGAIRGEEPVKFTDFATGVRYMEFTEAVARSAATNSPVDLPLQ
jgi:predicted dehydrogenase